MHLYFATQQTVFLLNKVNNNAQPLLPRVHTCNTLAFTWECPEYELQVHG